MQRIPCGKRLPLPEPWEMLFYCISPAALVHFFPSQPKEQENVSFQPRKQELAWLYFTRKLTNEGRIWAAPRDLNLFAAGPFYLQLASAETWVLH